MPRPTVLVATTDRAMAYALKSRLRELCQKLGLRLEICPGAEGEEDEKLKVRAYDCAEALFDHLASVASGRPMDLADTLVILDVGARLEEAFAPAASKDDGWHRTNNRAGVAVELSLRFPQVFPVILSPAVPLPEGVNETRKDEVIYPQPTSREQWQGFNCLREELNAAHKKPNCCKRVPCADSLMALKEPLHFVSPLDTGCGLYSTLARFARGMRCWFDPTGLRTLVRNRFLGTVFGSKYDWHNTRTCRGVLLERLDHMAVAIDEEREFAMLNAYAAYKFGRRAWMVTTYKEFNDKPLWVERPSNRSDAVVLRDIDLRFPDIDPSEVEKLRKELKKLQGWPDTVTNDWRIRVVTVDPNVEQKKEKFRKRISGLNKRTDPGRQVVPDDCVRMGQFPYPYPEERQPECHYLGLSKPISTIYDLKGLLTMQKLGDPFSVASRLRPAEDQSRKGGHGAPYLNFAMAESLLRQSRHCNDGPMENLLGALLAGEAYELLLGMSKTTALEALLAAHKQEVAAEVSFPGVSHSIDIDSRTRDMDDTLNELYLDPQYPQAKVPLENADRVKRMFLSQFWAELRIQYKDGEQFDAAEEANVQSLLNMSWKPRWLRRWPNVREVSLPQWVKKVVVFPATSLTWWFVSLVGSSLIFAVFYGLALCGISWEASRNFPEILSQVVLAMLQMQFSDLTGSDTDPAKKLIVAYPLPGDWYMHLLAVAHLGVSYVLFGLLLAMIYRKVTRG